MNCASILLLASFVFAVDDRIVGKWIFTAVFAALVAWLLLIPARRLGDADADTRWWLSTRVWAVLIAAVQMLVYAVWG